MVVIDKKRENKTLEILNQMNLAI